VDPRQRDDTGGAAACPLPSPQHRVPSFLTSASTALAVNRDSSSHFTADGQTDEQILIPDQQQQPCSSVKDAHSEKQKPMVAAAERQSTAIHPSISTAPAHHGVMSRCLRRVWATDERTDRAWTRSESASTTCAGHRGRERAREATSRGGDELAGRPAVQFADTVG